MRTIVYVDGYNLFYSVLRNTSYKWLDLHRLFDEHILAEHAPSSDIVTVKYFTSSARAEMSDDPELQNRQITYHQALKKNPKTKIIKGFHSPSNKHGRLIDEKTNKPAGDTLRVCVMEEKQTDVSIAIHMYRDAVNGVCEFTAAQAA